MADDKQRLVTDEELAIAYEGPALASNRFFVSISAAGVRIAFTEEHAKVGIQFRTAVMLSIPDAFALRDLLSRMLQGVEIKIEPISTEPPKAESDV